MESRVSRILLLMERIFVLMLLRTGLAESITSADSEMADAMASSSLERGSIPAAMSTSMGKPSPSDSAAFFSLRDDSSV